MTDNSTLGLLEDMEFLDKLTPEALSEALRGASHEMLEAAVRQLLGMVARAGIDMIEADRERMVVEARLGRAQKLPDSWRAYAKGCEDIMRTERNDYARGRWLGCAAQAFGCAEDLERVLALGTSKDKSDE